MARINLLPWREELRKQRQREFVVMAVGSAIFAGLVVLLAYMQIEGVIDHQKARNDFLQTEIAALDKRIEKIEELESTKAKLLARMNVIQELQRNRPLSVHLMDEIVRTLPEGVYLNQFTQKGQGLTMQGVAQSNARVSAYMRNIDGSLWLGMPKLDVIETKKDDRTRVAEFTLRASQMSPGQGDEGSGTAGDAP